MSACRVCGRELAGKRAGAGYCSAACRMRAYRARRKCNGASVTASTGPLEASTGAFEASEASNVTDKPKVLDWSKATRVELCFERGRWHEVSE